MGGDFKCLGQQGVPRKDSDALAKDLMIGELAPAIVIVVHRWEIIVDEGVSVDTFNGAGEGHGGGVVAATGGGCGEAKRRAHAFTAGEQGVTHGLVDGRRFGGDGWQEPIKGIVDRLRARGEIDGQIKG